MTTGLLGTAATGSLDLVLEVQAGEVLVTYRQDLFRAETAQRTAEHYATLLADGLARPDTPVGELELLTAEESHRVLREWNDTDHTVPLRTWPEMFAEQVGQRPDEIALVFEDTRLTYAELDERAGRLAHALVARGAGPERVVALAVPRSAELIIAEVAVLKSGAAYLPVDTDYPADRISYMLADAGPACLITTTEVADDIPPCEGMDVLVLDAPDVVRELSEPRPGAPAHGPLSVANAAYVIYTSGSTGRPKGVVLSHAGVAKLVATQTERFGIGPHSRVLQFASPSFDVAFWDLCLGLLSGGRLVVVPDRVAGARRAARRLRPRQRHHLHDPPAGAARRDARGRRTAARHAARGHRAGLARTRRAVRARPDDVQRVRPHRGDHQLHARPVRPRHPRRVDRADRRPRPRHPGLRARRPARPRTGGRPGRALPRRGGTRARLSRAART